MADVKNAAQDVDAALDGTDGIPSLPAKERGELLRAIRGEYVAAIQALRERFGIAKILGDESAMQGIRGKVGEHMKAIKHLDAEATKLT